MKTFVSIVFAVAGIIIILVGVRYLLDNMDKKSSNSSLGDYSSGNSDGFGNREGEMPGIGLPSDYFPTDIGRSWTYRIEVASTNRHPVRHQISSWPYGEDGLRSVRTRGIIYNFRDEKAVDGETKLVLRIVEKALKQGPLQYREGYKLKIERDDLNIYNDVTALYWAISTASRYEVTEVAMIDPSSSSSLGSNNSPWGSMDDREGYSLSFKLFGEKPMIAIGYGDEGDRLLFVGFDRLDGVPCLHFQRMVDAADRKEDTSNRGSSYFDSAFTEDVWYGKGIGLMKLIQKVDGLVTMTWTLEK